MTGDLFSPLPWYERPFAALDFEATGVDPFTARPVSFAAVIVDVQGKTIFRKHWLINAGVEIPAESTAVHGITNEMIAEHGSNPAFALRAIIDCVNEALREQMPLCIMNARYDWTLLGEEFRRQGFPEFARSPDILDPGLLDKGVDKYRKGKRTLADLCLHYGCDLSDAHTADADAIAAARLARAIVLRHPRLRSVTNAGALRDWQAGVFEEYRSFLSRGSVEKGIEPKIISPGWPLIGQGTT